MTSGGDGIALHVYDVSCNWRQATHQHQKFVPTKANSVVEVNAIVAKGTKNVGAGDYQHGNRYRVFIPFYSFTDLTKIRDWLCDQGLNGKYKLLLRYVVQPQQFRHLLWLAALCVDFSIDDLHLATYFRMCFFDGTPLLAE